MQIFFQGLLLQASLILALGAQNLFVLDSGLKKRFPFTVATVCSLCDVFLVFLGVWGAASVFVEMPWIKLLVGALGVGFLLYHGVKKWIAAFGINKNSIDRAALPKDRLAVVWASLGFSLLNPHVYLDTVVLIGGYSAKFPGWIERGSFGLGAGLCSVIWFFSLALAAVQLGRFLHSERAMRWVALVSGSILIVLAVVLAWGLQRGI